MNNRITPFFKKYSLYICLFLIGGIIGYLAKKDNLPGKPMPAPSEPCIEKNEETNVQKTKGPASAVKPTSFPADAVQDAVAILADAALKPGRPDYENLADKVQIWAEADPAGLFAYCQTLRETGENRLLAEYLEECLAKSWGHSDPDSAFAAAEKITDWCDRQTFVQHLLTGMSTVSPAAALDLMNQRPELTLSDRKNTAYEIYQTWAMKNPAEAFRHASANAHPDNRDMILTNLARMYGESQPEKAYEWATSLEDPYERRRAVIFSVRGITRVDLERATGILSDLEKEGQNEILVNQLKFQILEELSQYNQTEAYSFIQTVPFSSGRGWAIERLSSHWVLQNPENTLQWSRALPVEKERDMAVTAALSSWSEVDPAAAAEYVEKNTDLSIKPAMAGLIAEQWAETNPEKAMEFCLKHLPDEAPETDDSKTRVLSCLMKKDADKALEMITDFPNAFDEQKQIGPSIVKWIGESPHEINKVLDFIEDAQLSPKMMGAVATGWTSVDPGSAAKWIESLDEGEGKQNAIKSMLSQTTDTHPETVIEWALQVNNPETRLGFLRDAVTKIARLDPEAARQELRNTKFTDSERDQLKKDLEMYFPNQ